MEFIFSLHWIRAATYELQADQLGPDMVTSIDVFNSLSEISVIGNTVKGVPPQLGAYEFSIFERI